MVPPASGVRVNRPAGGLPAVPEGGEFRMRELSVSARKAQGMSEVRMAELGAALAVASSRMQLDRDTSIIEQQRKLIDTLLAAIARGGNGDFAERAGRAEAQLIEVRAENERLRADLEHERANGQSVFPALVTIGQHVAGLLAREQVQSDAASMMRRVYNLHGEDAALAFLEAASAELRTLTNK